MSETKKLSRKDLHLNQPDEFVTTTGRALEWAKHNQSTVTAAAAALTALLLGIAGWQWLQQSRITRSAQEFYAANELFRREQWDAAGKSFDDLAASLPGTPYGHAARLYAGRAALRAGKPAEAISKLQEFLANPLQDDAMEQLARVNLASALSAQGQNDQAVAEATKAVEMVGPAHGEALISLARVQEATGAKDKAIETYQ
ncbi:MAG: tetratricopeptide repeat protein, partial [Alphaproteobacteria bacterium]